MGLINPEEVCCGLTSKISLQENPLKEIALENSSSNPIPQDERIRKLEIQMRRLAEDVEIIKNQQCNAANAIQEAINRGVCGLGEHFRVLNNICVAQYGGTSRNERSSRTSCCSSSSATPSSIRVANLKDNAETPAGEKAKKVKEDKNGCGGFVLG